MRLTFVTATLLISTAAMTLSGEQQLGPMARTKPLEPADAVRSFEIQPGFQIELVASEPLIRSPVAIDFDENGRLFVAEYPEYNQHTIPHSQERGCIKVLEDTDGDGRFDKSTIYVENLMAPVAVACWNGGVYVGVVPDMWYFKDINGDGRADIRTRVLTGFDRDKAGEAMLNSFRWGIDNRFTIATGLAGGRLRRADQAESQAVPIRNQNIKFDPRTGEFTTTSGGGQHGLTFDNWGDTLTCENSHPIQQLVYDSHYLKRNPHVEAPSPLVDINAAGRHPNLRRISPPEPWREVRTRWRASKQFDGPDEGGQPFGFFTGATGVTVYRGDAFPEEYRGQIFVGEVANNLVYRARLEPRGQLWSATRADATREFLASRDTWFRPVQFANAPDGTLYIVDMYRELIETIESMPPSLLKHVDVAGGVNRGRIYRVGPVGFQKPPSPKMEKCSTDQLVRMLVHSNGWCRDTAARLLYARQDPSAVSPLRKLTNSSSAPVTRLHSHWALAGLNELTAADLLPALDDVNPRLRESALRLAERLIDNAEVRNRMFAMSNDADARVRFQLAFSLGALGKTATDGLAALARRDAHDPWMRFAILCSAAECDEALFARLAREAEFRAGESGRTLLIMLALQIVAANQTDHVWSLGRTLDELTASDSTFVKRIVTSVLQQSKTAAFPGEVAPAFARRIIAQSLQDAVDENISELQRVQSLRVLGHSTFLEVAHVVRRCLSVRQPDAIQIAALELLPRFDDARVPELVIDTWPEMSPKIRSTATETLFARPVWLGKFLEAIAANRVRSSDVDAAHVQVLLNHRNAELRTRASQVFGRTGLLSRKAVIDQFQPALRRRGDIVKGRAIFREHCSSCHRLDNEGSAVGPDLSTIRNHSPETVLINVLDPNREILPKYLAYQATTKQGVTMTGLMTAETANTITIRRADGTLIAIARAEIDELTSTGVSTMPEGFETLIDVAAMADLLAYLLERR